MRRTGWIALVLVAALSLTPASAHLERTKHSWNKHFKKLAKKLFYTEAEAEARFLDPAEGGALFLDRAEADALYLNAGEKTTRLISLTAEQLEVSHPGGTAAADATELGSVVPALQFDPDTPEEIVFSLRIPVDRDPASPLTVGIRWSSSATTGTVRWLTFMRIYGIGDTFPGLLAGQGVTAAPSGTAGAVVETILPTVPVEAIALGDVLAMKITRSADSLSSDTMADDANLLEVTISYIAAT